MESSLLRYRICFVLGLLLIHSGSSYGLYPFQNVSLSWDDRVTDLINRLTLEEIVPQTEAVYGGHTPEIPRLGIKPYVWITECVRGQVNANTTSFPHSIGMAATFSKELLHTMAEAVSIEVRSQWNNNKAHNVYNTFYGLSCFSPVVNIMRHPLWGRNQETYGECPFLSGSMAQQFVAGMHGQDGRYMRTTCGCKHFDAHGGPEDLGANRASFDAKVLMRDWRMTFLPQFKMCVDGGSYSLMCSYNAINGVPACANRQLLTDITRSEWGFKGYVVSDAGAVSNIISQHHYLNNSMDTAAASIKAGVNLELGSTIFQSQLDAMKEGKLTEAQIRENVRPLIYTRMRLGEFDPEENNPYNKLDISNVQSPQHRYLARVAARKSFVLMKNENDVLPIKKYLGTFAVVGPMSDNAEQMFGDYGSQILSQFTSTPVSAFGKLGATMKNVSGCDDNNCQKYDAADIQNAVSGSELVIVCLGTGQMVEREGHDRRELGLPGNQLQLLQDAVSAANGAPVIVILFNAGPLDIGWAKQSSGVSAILEVFFPAQSAGEALYDILTMTGGITSVPAARLPATWPVNINDIPPITDYTMDGRTYRYYKAEPLYPFGYGLSYSKFSYSSLSVSKTVVQGQSVRAKVSVTNMGPYDAEEVVQFYVHWPQTNVPIPKIQLVGFERVPIMVNETVNVEIQIQPEQLQVWIDDVNAFRILTGSYIIHAGGQQPDQNTKVPSNILMSSFQITSGLKKNKRLHKSMNENKIQIL